MAQIGHGYGSEWHLLRFLGRHRNLLEKEIKEQLKLDEKSSFNWLDFEFAEREKIISGDKELIGLSFLGEKDFFKEYPWGNSQSWDAIVKINDTWYLVEAKAHISEIRGGKCQATKDSKKNILEFMDTQMKPFGVNVKDNWLGDYYQMANRLAVAAYLNNKDISTKVLYIYFEDGYYDDTQDKDLGNTRKEFEKEIEKEKETLGIDKDPKIDELLCEVFINANPRKK